jgi:hypothetical protein
VNSILDRRSELRKLAVKPHGWWQVLQILRQLQKVEPGASRSDYARTTDDIIDVIVAIEFGHGK